MAISDILSRNIAISGEVFQTIGSRVSRAMRYTTAMLLPFQCLRCSQIIEGEAGLCPTCWPDVTFITAPLCRVTGVPLPDGSVADTMTGLHEDEKPLYRRARSALVYDDGSKPMVLAFKHGDQTHYAPTFVTWMLRAGAELCRNADIVCPVPLHRWRMLRRKFNQAALLAESIAEAHNLNYQPDLLIRCRATASQGKFSASKRAQNVKGAFAVNEARLDQIQGQTILLVDDVYTSGATVNECAKILKEAGAGHVDVLTLARVI